jgi:hypothetical protein
MVKDGSTTSDAKKGAGARPAPNALALPRAIKTLPVMLVPRLHVVMRRGDCEIDPREALLTRGKLEPRDVLENNTAASELPADFRFRGTTRRLHLVVA